MPCLSRQWLQQHPHYNTRTVTTCCQGHSSDSLGCSQATNTRATNSSPRLELTGQAELCPSDGQHDHRTLPLSDGQHDNRTLPLLDGQHDNRTLPLSDGQHDNRTCAAGWPTARQPQASVVAGGAELVISLDDLQCTTTSVQSNSFLSFIL